MTGIEMLLGQLCKGFGLTPETVQNVFRQFSEQMPNYLNAIGQKVCSIDDRLARLEHEALFQRAVLLAIAAKTGVDLDTINTSIVRTDTYPVGSTNGNSGNGGRG